MKQFDLRESELLRPTPRTGSTAWRAHAPTQEHPTLAEGDLDVEILTAPGTTPGISGGLV